jgi:hypothetical protein
VIWKNEQLVILSNMTSRGCDQQQAIPENRKQIAAAGQTTSNGGQKPDDVQWKPKHRSNDNMHNEQHKNTDNGLGARYKK